MNSHFDDELMSQAVNAIKLSPGASGLFKEKGFIKIKSLLTEESIASLRNEALRRVVSAADSGTAYGDEFKRLTYGLGETEIIKSICASDAFKELMVGLTGHQLIMTESQSFELTPEHNGFPWHYDSLSFRYIRPQDRAYSIWIPLDPICKAEQGGGMAYVPENIFSAKANFQISSLLSAKIEKNESIDSISKPLFEIYKTPSLLTELFEIHKEEDDFEPGDVFLFTKSVWHRSEPLKDGPMKSRLAVTIRFLDSESRLDRIMFEGENESGGGVGMGADWGKPTQTTYGSQFKDIEQGEEIRNSKFCGMII